jgi:adenine-specific DNA-methyltransferase
MNLRDSQTFLSFYRTPCAPTVATGDSDSFAAVGSWQGETKQLGQVATPERLAALLARWVLSAKPSAVLDPAVGLGGLLKACRNLDSNIPLHGVERDSETFRRARDTAPCGANLVMADYLKAEVGPFDGIIANPPYVKAHRLGYAEGDWLYLEERLGMRFDRLTNLYGLFLIKIWEDLAPGGRAAVLLPAEFLNANFGREIKERLVSVIRPAAIMVFAPSINLFSDALTTSAILLLGKGTGHPGGSWARRMDSIEEAEAFVGGLCDGRLPCGAGGCLDMCALSPGEKWLNLLLNGGTDDEPFLPRRVGDYFTCRRGIATGANDFFCLSRADLGQHQLSESHVVPCITKAMDADGLVFSREKLRDLAASHRRCFLLSPTQEGHAGEAGRNLMRYLRRGEQQGIPTRHLPSHRPTWYLPENRGVASIWVAVFSRGTVKYILNTSGAKNLTCFHGLYPQPGRESMAPLLTLFLNSSSGRKAFGRVQRFYGDGLNKLEPKDVEDMPCPVMPVMDAAEAQQLTAALVSLESLPNTERGARIDALAARYFDCPVMESRPASSHPHPA